MQLSSMALAATAMPSASAAPQRPLPKSEFDYVDWSWQRWRRISGESKPRVVGEQSRKAELVYPIDVKAGRANPSADLWNARRQSLKQLIGTFLGPPPQNRPALDVKVVEEIRLSTHLRRKLTYQTEQGEHVPAYLLTPANIRGRLPVVLCPHQTTIPLTSGMREPAGLEGNPALHTALHLVERGYVTFTWDALCFGSRHDPARGHYGDSIPFYQKHPHWALLGKMVWDLSRGIDYLTTLDFIDPQRIGSIGHSHGGITTLFGMAFDERIKVGVSNCGFDTFRIDGNVWRWSRATALMPRLGFYIGSRHLNMDFYRAVPDSEVIETPFDMHELLALIAPRALLLSTSDEDFVFPNAGWSARQSLARVAPVYRLFDKEANLDSYFFKGGHSFPTEASNRAYEWLDRWLKT